MSSRSPHCGRRHPQLFLPLFFLPSTRTTGCPNSFSSTVRTHRCGQPGQQHGRRIPSLSSEHTLSTCCLLVSSFLTEMVQQIHSLRASGVTSSQAASAFASVASAFRRSAGRSCTTPPEIRRAVIGFPRKLKDQASATRLQLGFRDYRGQWGTFELPSTAPIDPRHLFPPITPPRDRRHNQSAPTRHTLISGSRNREELCPFKGLRNAAKPRTICTRNCASGGGGGTPDQSTTER